MAVVELGVPGPGQFDDPLSEGVRDGVPWVPATVAVDERRDALALVAGLQALEVTDRHVEREGGLDDRQSTGQQLGQHVQPALPQSPAGARAGCRGPGAAGSRRRAPVVPGMQQAGGCYRRAQGGQGSDSWQAAVTLLTSL